MQELELKNLLSEAIFLGIQEYQSQFGNMPKYLSKNQAYQKYGRKIVDRWIKEGLIKELKDGDKQYKIRLDRLELEKVAAFSNRPSFFRHRESCR